MNLLNSSCCYSYYGLRDHIGEANLISRIIFIRNKNAETGMVGDLHRGQAKDIKTVS